MSMKHWRNDNEGRKPTD